MGETEDGTKVRKFQVYANMEQVGAATTNGRLNCRSMAKSTHCLVLNDADIDDIE